VVIKKALIAGLTGAVLWSSLGGMGLSPSIVLANTSAVQTEPSPFSNLTLVKQEPVTSGAVLYEYSWKNSRGPVKISVIEVDLQNPHIKVDSISGQGGKVALRDNVSDLAKDTGAIAASNADFFVVQGDGAPLGVQMSQGEWVSSPAYLQGIYSLGISSDRKAWIDQFTFNGLVTGPTGSTFPLAGINKSLYWEEPGKNQSHVDRLHVYSSAWGKATRGGGTNTTPTEALIKDGAVQNISIGKALEMAPPEGSYILRGHGKAADFMKEWKIGETVQIDYQMSPQKEWQMVIGGHGLLVDEGKVATYTRDPKSLGGSRARTAMGYKQDQRHLQIVAVEGNSSSSVGMTLEELAKFMVHIGTWKAVNMDGGGSTTLVARPLGENGTDQVVRPEHGNERLVPNAVGVYSTAPKGELAGLKVKGPTLLFLNELATYQVYGYDQYYNPYDITSIPVQWKTEGNPGNFDNQTFIPTFPGKYRIHTTTGSTNSILDIQVLGRKDISELTVSSSSLIMSPGEKVQLSVTATTASGEKRKVPNSSLKWEVHGLTGTVNETGLFTYHGDVHLKKGFVVARYDEYSVAVPIVSADQRKLVDFESVNDYAFESNMPGVTGSFVVEADSSQQKPSQVGVLNYSFEAGTGTKAAYVRFGPGGLTVPGAPIGIKLDVRGDQGLHWLRAELIDAAGKVHRVNLADSVNWSGWKTVEASLQDLNITYPIKLNRIYLANMEQGQDERALKGSIAFDHISFKYGEENPAPDTAQVQITIGKKDMVADGVSSQLQLAPTIIENTTYVPVRDLSEILGARVLYSAPTRRVSVSKGTTWIDLWQNDQQMIVNGKNISLATPVKNVKGVTMVPLRVVSETFGLTVQWDAKTKSITLSK
jgi:hypothetical protein